MKVGDIIYFKSTYFARYSKSGGSGSYEYYFKPGDRYRINYINYDYITTNVNNGNITNLEDGTNHFAHSKHWERIITKEEHRELQLIKLGI